MQGTREDVAAAPNPVLSAWRGLVMATFLVVVAGCGGGSGGGVSPPPPPPPATATITSLSPPSVVAGSGSFTLTVNGTGFVDTSTVSLAGTPLGTAFVSATQLTATVPAATIVATGSLAVQVTNAGGASSNAFQLDVSAAPAVFAIASISPTTLSLGSAPFTLTVTGTGFTAASRVSFDGTILATTFVSSTQLTAAAPALVGIGDLSVVVVDGPRTSASLTFQVTADGFPVVLSPTYFSSTVYGDRDSTIAAADAQGRFVAFQSMATNLVAGDLSNGTFNSIYLRDTCVGAAAGCAASTSLVSRDPAGAQCVLASAGLGSMNPRISSDGRFVVFFTDSCFPGAPATARQIALRDTCNTAAGPVANCTAATTLVSATPSGQASTSGTSSITQPAMSGNGRYIVWSSNATDLVANAGDGTFLQLYLRDRCATSAGAVAGCTAKTILVSTVAGAVANYDASDQYPAVSDNGIVALHTSASNLVAHPTLQPGSGGSVFRADCSNGVTQCAFSIVGIVPGTGSDTTGIRLDTQLPTISRDGRFIAFMAQGEDSTGSLVATPPPNLPSPHLQLPGRQAMLFDSCIGVAGAVPGCTPSFAYESVLDNGNLDISLAAQGNQQPTLSDDGRFVAFAVPYDLAPGYQTGGVAAYVRDTCGAGAPVGCVPRIALVSVDAQHVVAGTVGSARISGDGHFVVFYSVARSPPGTSGNLPAGQIVMVRTGF